MNTSAESQVKTHAVPNKGWSRFVAIVLLLHVPLFIYPILRLCDWLDASALLTTLVFVPLVTSQVISRVYFRDSRSEIIRFIRRCFDLWLGTSPILLILLLCAELYVLVFNPDRAAVALVVIGLATLSTIGGFITALYPVVRRIPLSSHKIRQPIKIVQITDVHIGSRSHRFLQQVVRKINDLEPDYVCITGDFIDASGVTLAELQSLNTIKVPVYFSIGNHEKYEDLDDIVTRLKQLGVRVLRNAAQTVEHRQSGKLQFIGIDDMDDALQVARQLANIDIASDAYTVLLYHRPRGLGAAEAAGIDLMMSGHTHNGQIVPFNFAVKRVFPKIQGLYQQGSTRLYVSTGTGTWGPIMRIGTRSEITLFELSPLASCG